MYVARLDLNIPNRSHGSGYRKVDVPPSEPHHCHRPQSRWNGTHGDSVRTRYAVCCLGSCLPPSGLLNGCYATCSSPEEAGNYVRTLQALLRSVGSSDGNMEQVRSSLSARHAFIGSNNNHSFHQGSLRCDVNVSVHRIGDSPGTRCEIKNLNSVKFMMVAIST